MSVIETTYKHISRTYHDVYNSLVAAYPKSSTWMFKQIAGMFWFASELVNNIAQDIFDPFTREAAYHFAAHGDYDPTESDGAETSLTITLTGPMVKTIPVGHRFGGISETTGKLVQFEVTTAASSGGGGSITANVKQKKSFTSVNLGLMNSTEAYTEIPIRGYLKIIKTTITLTIDSLTWTRVDNFDDSISTDRHFKLIYQSNGKARVMFGDGTYGKIPTLNDTIFANFAVTEGLSGKMGAATIVLDLEKDADISSVTNASATTGGNDQESVASIKRQTRANARTRNIVWSQEDVETVAKQNASVVKALCVPGIGTCVVHIIPSGGGNPSAGLKTTVAAAIKALTQFGVMPVTASNPTYLAQAITATITVLDGFVSATVADLVEFALTMCSTAIDSQVIDSFDSDGIDVCRTDVINVIWPGWAFTSDENDALEFIIEKWKELLVTREYREWGQSLEVGDLWEMGNSLRTYGVDEFSLTAPVANVTATSTQIIDNTSSTVTV